MIFRLGCQFYVRLPRQFGEQDGDRDAEDGVITDGPAAQVQNTPGATPSPAHHLADEDPPPCSPI